MARFDGEEEITSCRRAERAERWSEAIAVPAEDLCGRFDAGVADATRGRLYSRGKARDAFERWTRRHYTARTGSISGLVGLHTRLHRYTPRARPPCTNRERLTRKLGHGRVAWARQRRGIMHRCPCLPGNAGTLADVARAISKRPPVNLRETTTGSRPFETNG